MIITTKKINIGILVELEGDLDLYSASDFKEEMNNFIIKYKNIILSLRNVKYIDSSGIGVLLYLFTYCNSKSTRVLFCNLQKSVINIISLSQLDKFLPIKKNIQDSIISLKTKEWA